MAAKTPPSAWIAFTALLFFTIAFGASFFVADRNVKDSLGQREGGTIPADDTLPGLLAKQKTLSDAILKAKADQEAKQQDLNRAELDLVSQRTSYDLAGNLASATATATRSEETIDGTTKRSKVSPWKVVADRVAAQKAHGEAQTAAAKSDENGRFQTLDDAIKKRQDDLQAVLKIITEQEQKYRADQEALTKKQEDLNKEKEQVERKGRDDLATRSTRINSLEDEIRRLLELDLKFVSEILPNGKVLEVNERGDRAVIDLATKDRIVPGMMFMLFSYDQGRFIEKGMVEVIRVTGTISEVRVNSLIDGRRLPVARNDLIGNPVYNPAKPPVFVFAGEFSEYNREDLAQFVSSAGGKVVDSLQPGVDFLVVRGDSNDRSDKERALAREYQILAITERQLLRFVRPAFAPK
jgi:hypothetical protein